MHTQVAEEVGPVLTVREAASELKCSISFVYKLMNLGELAFERRGRRKLPLARSVSEYRQRNVVHSSSKAGLGPTPTQPRRYMHLFSKGRR
jgi:excisionase family DNA binding protein